MLAIVGNNTDAYKDPVFQGDAEIWVFNGKGATLPRYDVVFQMHLPVDWGGGWCRRWFANNTTIPVYMNDIYPDVPMSKRYPFEDVFDMLKHVRHNGNVLKYFTSSFAWAIALAVLQEKPEIRIVGASMVDAEYINQKDCFAFWLGFAGGRGIKLDIDCADNIFDKPLYGSYPLQ